MSSRVIIMREATIRIVKMLAEKSVRVTQRGVKAFVEYSHTGRPVRVNIPYIPDDASEELLDAIQGFIDHEVAHILFTDYNVLAEAKKKGVARLHNIIEDSFIERKMADHFTGCGLNLRNVGTFFLKTYTDVELKKTPEYAEGILLVPAVRSWAGQTVFTDYMADKWHLMEKVVAALGDAIEEVPLCTTSQDCLYLALKFKERLEAARPKKPKPPVEPKLPEPTSEDESEPEPGTDGAGEEGMDAPDTGDDLPLDMPPAEAPAPVEMDLTEDDDEHPDPDYVPEPGSEPEEPPPVDDRDPMDEPGDGSEIPDLDVGDYADDTGTGEGAPVPDPLSDDGDDEFKTGAYDPEAEERRETTDEVPEMEEEDHGGEVAKSEVEEKPEPAPGEPESPVEEPDFDGSAHEKAEMPETPTGGSEEDYDEDEPSLMEKLDSMLTKRDYDEAIAEALTKKSAEEGKEADYLIYTTELDVIEPMDVGSHRGHWSESHLKTLTDTVDHMVGPLQKDLERAMAARSLAVWSPGHRSGRLNPSALARLTTFGDDRAFRRRHTTDSKDVAVMLMDDCSGSMTGSKIRTAAYSSYGLAAVLDRMGIANEVLGYTTQDNLPAEMHAEASRLGVTYARHETLYIPIIKSFNERMTSEVKKRFAALPNVHWLSENVDGESIQIGAQRLAQRREKRKIMIVLSDGQPACPGDFRLLARHLKKAVADVEKSGIEVVAIGIESDAPRHFYSKYVLLNDVTELPGAVMGKIKELLMK